MWEKTTQKGGKFLSGQITINGEAVKFVAFKNGYKKEDRHPDWKLYLSKPKEVAQHGSNDAELNNLPNPAHSSGYSYPQTDIDPNDIPF